MEHGFDEETFEIFKSALANKDPVVRGAAVTGSIYLGWPELVEPLEEVAANKSEKDESIRKDAALIASRLRKQHKKKKS